MGIGHQEWYHILFLHALDPLKFPNKSMAPLVADHLWAPFFRKDMGCSVVGSAGTATGLEAVVKAGADQAVNHRRWDYGGPPQKSIMDGDGLVMG